VNKIYLEISKLSDKFKTMSYGLTKDKEEIDDAVQELMLYFLQMNPETLKKIYDKDGLDGITRYGAVVLKRALTSPRSPFYYKYKKYYKNLIGVTHKMSSSFIGKLHDNYHSSIYNIPEEIVESIRHEQLNKIDAALEGMYWYDVKIFELYYSGETLDSLAAKTKISRNSLFTTIDKVRTILKKELLDE
tara:strand:- start:94 stop:660 length:567 start_codon:yes stop_codon:yes gene_type:complete